METSIIENKFDYFDEVIENKISPEQAIKFLNDKDIRSLFIFEYDYFGEDKNEKTYQDFINNSLLTKNTGKIASSLDLAIMIDYFSPNVLNKITELLNRRITYEVKLSALDYISTFSTNIDSVEYKLINENTLFKSSNQLVRFQSVVNLLPIESEKYSKSIIRRLKATKYPAYFYRLINSINESNEIENAMDLKFLETIKEIIDNKAFKEEVKNELFEDLNELIERKKIKLTN